MVYRTIRLLVVTLMFSSVFTLGKVALADEKEDVKNHLYAVGKIVDEVMYFRYHGLLSIVELIRTGDHRHAQIDSRVLRKKLEKSRTQIEKLVAPERCQTLKKVSLELMDTFLREIDVLNAQKVIGEDFQLETDQQIDDLGQKFTQEFSLIKIEYNIEFIEEENLSSSSD